MRALWRALDPLHPFALSAVNRSDNNGFEMASLPAASNLHRNLLLAEKFNSVFSAGTYHGQRVATLVLCNKNQLASRHQTIRGLEKESMALFNLEIKFFCQRSMSQQEAVLSP